MLQAKLSGVHPPFLPVYSTQSGIQHQEKLLDAGACYHLGLQFYNKGLYAKALEFFLSLSHNKQSPYYLVACLKLWRIYRCGNAVVPDMASSDCYGQQVAAQAQWFKDQASTGDAEAIYNLGELHSSGLGVPVDDEEAYHCYEQAAAKDHAMAQAKLGYLCGLKQKDVEAKRRFKEAALQDNVVAQHRLGDLCAQQDTLLSNRQALRWYEQAAKQGHAPAQCSLAALYLKGASGVQQNYNQARFWYTCAAAEGDAEAQYWLGILQGSAQAAHLTEMPCSKKPRLS